MKEIITVLTLFILPLALIFFKLIPRQYYLITLGIVLLCSIIVTVFEQTPLTDLGIRTDNLKQTFLPHLLFTLICLVILLIIIKIRGVAIIPDWQTDKHFQYMFILISFAQAFLFLSFLMQKLNAVIPNIYISLAINALFFVAIHFFYTDFYHESIILFLVGFGFATVYYHYPNLLWAGLSHAILNFTVVLFGFLSKIKI